MPSLADVHGGQGSQQATADDPRGGDEPVTAGDAAEVTLELSSIGIVCFLLGIGITFFFDSLVGTVGYITALGVIAWVILRWIVATVPRRDLPDLLTPSRHTTPGVQIPGLTALRSHLPGRGQTRHRGQSRLRRWIGVLAARLRRTLTTYRSSRRRRGGDRL